MFNSKITQEIFKWAKMDPAGVAPYKKRISDSGYDLTIIKKVETIDGVKIDETIGAIEIYDTGIKVQPCSGWSFDLVARSSLWKQGRLLVNGIGIIDSQFRGSVTPVMWKFDSNAGDLQLPARLVQLVPRLFVHCDFVEAELDETERNTQGFGSSGL